MPEERERPRPRTRSLVAVLTTALLALSVSTLLVVSGFQVFTFVRAYQEFVIRQQQLITQDVARTVTDFIQDHFRVLEATTRVTKVLWSAPQAQQDFLIYLMSLQPSIRHLVLLNYRGWKLAEYARASMPSAKSPLERLSADWLDQVNRGQRYISPVYVDERTSEPMVVIAVPVTNILGDIQGALVAEVNLKFMWDLVDRLRVGDTGFAYVVDRDGNLLAFRDIARVLQGENVAYLKEVGEFVGSLAPVDETGASISRGIEGTLVVATYAPLGTPDWAVVTEIPVAEAYRPIINSLILVGAVLVTVIVIVGGFSNQIARRLSAPLRQLASISSRIAGGELSLEARVERGPAEVVSLAQAFNQMTARLRELISGLEQQVAARTAALTRRTTELEAAAYVARRAAEIRRMDMLLNETVRVISDRFGFYHAGIFLIDEGGEYAVLHAASSEGGQRMLARGHRLEVGRVGIVGYVAGTGQPRIALDVGADAVFFDNPDLPETRSEMALPLKIGDRVIGVLDVQSREPAAFTDEDVAILQVMADQIALAIENARLLEEAERALAEVRALYGEYLRGAWRQLARRQRTLGYRRTIQGGRFLTPEEVQSLQEDPTVWPVLARGEIHVQAASDDGGEARLLAPVRLQEQVIGVLQIRPPVRNYRWSPEEIALVRSIADRLALALENARLLEETRRRAERDRLIAEITARVRASLDPKIVLQTAVKELGQALGVSRVLLQMGTELSLQGDGAQPDVEGNGRSEAQPEESPRKPD
ncbi:MAG: GAF domain-containing protein [Anaerolineae bacterium]|nr:GAF domain-containing protein [Anaerolineae bacterium]MDW8068621.1 GAF domain-containing protein [Anaerolineae bacterium]